MRLLNFSIGKVQTVQIGSESIRTAYVKIPIPEPWTITDEGAEGDQRAVHPDKIYAYARTQPSGTFGADTVSLDTTPVCRGR